MAVVIASNLRKELAGAVLFDGVSFSVERGELNPMVAALQGRLGLEGDYGLAIKVLYGFHGGGYPFVTPAEV